MLFVGDDWAEDHHDVEMVDEAGRLLARPTAARGARRDHPAARADRRAPAGRLDRRRRRPEQAQRGQVGIETDRGPWVAALVAAGYEVFAINPLSVARYRERHSTSGAKSDAGRCARAGRDRPRSTGPTTGRSPATPTLAEAVKLAARTPPDA